MSEFGDENHLTVAPLHTQIPPIVLIGDFAVSVLPENPANTLSVVLALKPYQHALVDPEI